MDDSSRSRVRRDSTSGSDTKTNKRKVTVKKEIMDDDDGKYSDNQDFKSKKAKYDIKLQIRTQKKMMTHRQMSRKEETLT
jgi:hypothetical protein